MEHGNLIDPSTNLPLKVSSADTTVASDGSLRDQASNKVIATASALQSLAIDSRLPDLAWDELKYIDVRNDNGGSVHLFVQAFTRVPSPHALHGSYVMIHSTIGTITLDGDLMTFSESSSTRVFAAAQFEVSDSGRRLFGVIYLIGFFNQIPSFDGWNTTYDTPPRMPSIFYANASLMYACAYENSNLCDDADLPAESTTVFAGKVWSVSRVDMWADLNEGIGKEMYSSLAANPGWTFEKHLDLNAKTEHIMQTWQASNESYFCRTTPQPLYMSTWMSPVSADSSKSSYKGEVDFAGEMLHHFQIKPATAEHISLDFYTHLVGQDVIPAFVQLRIGPDVETGTAGDKDARFIAYKFDSFQPLQSLPDIGLIFDQSNSSDPFNVSFCADTLAYTDQEQEGTKIHLDNMIISTDPLTTPPSRTALTYVLGTHPTWKASDIIAWEDQLVDNLTAYVMYQLYLDPQPSVQAYLDSNPVELQNGTSHGRALGTPYRGTEALDGAAWVGVQLANVVGQRGRSLAQCVDANRTECDQPASREKVLEFPSNAANLAGGGGGKGVFSCSAEYSYPLACEGELKCNTPEVPLCCGGLVKGWISGSAAWDCAKDFSHCEASASIAGEMKVGIPRCSWCPAALEFSISFSRTAGVQACCAGAFSYTKDAITLEGAFAGGVVTAEMAGVLYALKDTIDCNKKLWPNYIRNDNRKMVIKGDVKICVFGFCYSVVSGDLFMLPEIAPPTGSNPFAKKSGECCLLVNAITSRHSCEYCPRGHRYRRPPFGYWSVSWRRRGWRWYPSSTWISVPGCWSSRKCS